MLCFDIYTLKQTFFSACRNFTFFSVSPKWHRFTPLFFTPDEILQIWWTVNDNILFSPKEVTEEDCVLTEWGEWSKCIKICGQEPIKRSRSFKWLDNQERCEEKFEKPILEEKIDCGNPPCPVDTFVSITVCNNISNTSKISMQLYVFLQFCVEPRYNTWSDWSPCSATQGVGFKVRQRTIKVFFAILLLLYKE